MIEIKIYKFETLKVGLVDFIDFLNIKVYIESFSENILLIYRFN